MELDEEITIKMSLQLLNGIMFLLIISFQVLNLNSQEPVSFFVLFLFQSKISPVEFQIPLNPFKMPNFQRYRFNYMYRSTEDVNE